MPPNTRQTNKRSRIHGVEQCQQISSSQPVEAERQTESHGHGGSLQSESSHVLRDLETNIPHVEVETSAGTKKKRVRGPTCMPKLWGLQPNNLVEVSFNYLGQPNDEKKTTTLSHFLGTIARNGRYCPLQYSDWRLIPESYKDEMKKLVKAKFDLPPGHDPFVMKSINKKWRNWKCTLKSLNFDPDVPVEEQMLEIPKGVNEDQYKKLIEHWISDKSKSVCEKNKQTRSKLEFFHRMGKKSFAIIRETMKKHLGRYPTRAELFEECYYKQDGSPMSQAVLEVIEKMKELEAQNSENSAVDDDAILVSNDVFSKVMGKDKEGQVRMYGLGVKATDVYGGKPSRAALERKNMDYEIQLKMMNDKIEELTSLVHGRSCSNNEQPEVEMNHVVSPSQSNPQISSATAPNNHHTSAKTSSSLPIKVRSKVVLKKFGNMDEIVATGIVWAMSGVRANGIDLGDDFCEVSIQHVLKPDVKLFLGPEDMDTLFDALGAPIPWPISLVALADED